MIKKLSLVGNSLGLVIEKPILELLKITRDTQLEITTDGENIFIRPIRGGHTARVSAATEAVLDEHADTFRRLAE